MEKKAIYNFMHDWNGDTFMSAKRITEKKDVLIGTKRDNAHNITQTFAKRLEQCLEVMNVGDTLTLEVVFKYD